MRSLLEKYKVEMGMNIAGSFLLEGWKDNPHEE